MKPFCLLGATFSLFLFTCPSLAIWRVPYEDADVVARSDLIVVCKIKPDSLQYVSHTGSKWGNYWEHRAMLVVREVLKGNCDSHEMSVVIRYGLEPLVDGHSKHEGFEANGSTNGPPGFISIVDDDNFPFRHLVSDAREDNIWCLRRGGFGLGLEPGKGDFGITDIEDLQPLKLEKYLCCYLSKDSASAVRNQMAKQPQIAGRELRYLQHLTVQRILTEPDPAVRAVQLIPFFQSGAKWADQEEATEGIVAVGAVAGPYLMGAYQQTVDADLRIKIIRTWGKIKYTGCIDGLIDLLNTEDDYRSQQKLPPNWLNEDSPSQQHWRDQFDQMTEAVSTLGEIGDRRATNAIVRTRKR